MFGIKNPQKMLGMLKMFGISPETLLPQLETLLVTEFKKLESEAGANIMAVAVMDATKSHFVISLYKVLPDGRSEPYKSFPLSDISTILKNIETNENDPNTKHPVAQLPGGANRAESEPESNHNEDTDLRAQDEYPAFQ
jgi:hypothetical protein